MLPSFGRPRYRAIGRELKIIPVAPAERSHPFPSRTRKLSSPAPKILGGQLPGKIGRRRDIHERHRPRRTTCPRGHRAFTDGYAGYVDRVCPFLALEADLRTAMAGYDPDHRCLAIDDPQSLDRATQQSRCLIQEHVRCERFVARSAALLERRRTPLPAPDARFISTRLVIEPDESWRPMRLAARPLRRRRLAMTGATLLVVGTAGVALATRGFAPTAAALPTPDPSGLLAASATAQPKTPPTPPPTARTSPRPSSAVPTPTPPAATATPQGTPHVYVAQKGDSMSRIAARFGVTIEALMAANGLANPNIVNIGQVLVIPD